ncbi:peptidase [Ahniella affigens]|uniref:Peptidase n=1 Tax=Ahniella affigens TaxID=2021234 RepID=A0A2P1PPX6_9GAMM|nr:M13 family metallopeptidase [Ahniella affigens]AVP96894.1 peptidase [Ahniella affigens]
MRIRLLSLALTSALVAGPALAFPALDAKNFDTSVPACTDFYQHANGNWLKTTTIPAEYSSWGVFNEINERNLETLKSVLESAAANQNAKPGSNEQKLGDFYAAAMDEAAIEKAGRAPIDPELKQIDALTDRAGVVALINDWQSRGNSVLFGLGKEADLKNSTTNIAYAVQGGLALPDRDYYTKTDADSVALRAKYFDHMTKMLELAGTPADQARLDAAEIMQLETRLANASLTNIELRNPANFYNISTIADASKATPNYNWAALFKAIGRDDITTFSFSHPKFFAEMDKALGDTPISTWKAYLRWNLVHNAADYLSKDFVDASFDFNGKTLRGAKELRPRWKRVADQVDTALGEALGQAFVEKRFSAASKKRMLELVNNLQTSLKARLQKLDWMGDATKEQALAKFATFTPKIGYPDKWRDYSGLTVSRNSYWNNIQAARTFEAKRQYGLINKPVDRTEWGMLPHEVNAYYNPLKNEIAFPAGILQPPFFNADADDAVNYGSIGGVIGHELMHGFDDQGSQFDAQGNLRMWWTDEDRKAFEARTKKLVEQFNEFVAIEDKHVNGELTLGENIADLGGLLVSYDAFKMTPEGQSNEKIDSLTPDQRFFHAWAQGWRRLHTDQDLKLRLNTDPHSPAVFRVQGPFANIDAFASAFGCKAGDPMVRSEEKRVRIW